MVQKKVRSAQGVHLGQGRALDKGGGTKNQCSQNKNPQKAVEMYALAFRMLKTATYKPQILLNLALCYQRLGNSKDAIVTLKQVLKIDPNYSKAKKILHVIENELKKSS